MELQLTLVQVAPLDGGAPRFGVLAEGEGARSLLALAATSKEELSMQVEDCGGPGAYLRRYGALPLDPEGIAADGASARWVSPPAS